MVELKLNTNSSVQSVVWNLPDAENGSAFGNLKMPTSYDRVDNQLYPHVWLGVELYQLEYSDYSEAAVKGAI